MPSELFLQQCQQETAALHALLSLLEEEQRAIVRFDALKLDACAVSKQQQLQLLQDSKAQRLALLAAHQLDGKTAFLSWLSAAEPALQQAWMALEHELAKVQALKGDSLAEMATLEQLVSRYPQSARRAEAEFRRGDHLYNDGRYGDGWQAFTTAASLGSGALARNAAYMAGWCQFKSGDLDAAGSEFLALLKQRLGGSAEATVAASDDPALSEDLLRALSLTLLLGDGVASLDALRAIVASFDGCALKATASRTTAAARLGGRWRRSMVAARNLGNKVRPPRL